MLWTFSVVTLLGNPHFPSALSPGIVSVLCVVWYVYLFFLFCKCTILTRVSLGLSIFILSTLCGEFRSQTWSGMRTWGLFQYVPGNNPKMMTPHSTWKSSGMPPFYWTFSKWNHCFCCYFLFCFCVGDKRVQKICGYPYGMKMQNAFTPTLFLYV